MKFATALRPARLIRRYKRFLADVELPGGKVVTVHCPNPGAMTGLDAAGSEIWLSAARSATRKLPYGWELIRVGDGLVGINTNHPNELVAEAISDGRIVELRGYATQRREVKYGRNSRIDILLEDDNRPSCYVEVKNVHLKRNSLAEFPDCVTARGAKHLEELRDMVAAGKRAVMVYLVQRGDCDRFAIAADIDPAYAKGLARAVADGVEAICYDCRVSTTAIEVAGPLPIEL
ncbi:MAG: DNA/RNA nuclease SfsA [Dongiaceae bacterium]